MRISKYPSDNPLGNPVPLTVRDVSLGGPAGVALRVLPKHEPEGLPPELHKLYKDARDLLSRAYNNARKNVVSAAVHSRSTQDGIVQPGLYDSMRTALLLHDSDLKACACVVALRSGKPLVVYHTGGRRGVSRVDRLYDNVLLLAIARAVLVDAKPPGQEVGQQHLLIVVHDSASEKELLQQLGFQAPRSQGRLTSQDPSLGSAIDQADKYRGAAGQIWVMETRLAADLLGKQLNALAAELGDNTAAPAGPAPAALAPAQVPAAPVPAAAPAAPGDEGNRPPTGSRMERQQQHPEQHQGQGQQGQEQEQQGQGLTAPDQALMGPSPPPEPQGEPGEGYGAAGPPQKTTGVQQQARRRSLMTTGRPRGSGDRSGEGQRENAAPAGDAAAGADLADDQHGRGEDAAEKKPPIRAKKRVRFDLEGSGGDDDPRVRPAGATPALAPSPAAATDAADGAGKGVGRSGSKLSSSSGAGGSGASSSGDKKRRSAVLEVRALVASHVLGLLDSMGEEAARQVLASIPPRPPSAGRNIDPARARAAAEVTLAPLLGLPDANVSQPNRISPLQQQQAAPEPRVAAAVDKAAQTEPRVPPVPRTAAQAGADASSSRSDDGTPQQATEHTPGSQHAVPTGAAPRHPPAPAVACRPQPAPRGGAYAAGAACPTCGGAQSRGAVRAPARGNPWSAGNMWFLREVCEESRPYHRVQHNERVRKLVKQMKAAGPVNRGGGLPAGAAPSGAAGASPGEGPGTASKGPSEDGPAGRAPAEDGPADKDMTEDGAAEAGDYRGGRDPAGGDTIEDRPAGAGATEEDGPLARSPPAVAMQIEGARLEEDGPASMVLGGYQQAGVAQPAADGQAESAPQPEDDTGGEGGSAQPAEGQRVGSAACRDAASGAGRQPAPTGAPAGPSEPLMVTTAAAPEAAPVPGNQQQDGPADKGVGREGSMEGLEQQPAPSTVHCQGATSAEDWPGGNAGERQTAAGSPGNAHHQEHYQQQLQQQEQEQEPSGSGGQQQQVPEGLMSPSIARRSQPARLPLQSPPQLPLLPSPPPPLQLQLHPLRGKDADQHLDLLQALQPAAEAHQPRVCLQHAGSIFGPRLSSQGSAGGAGSSGAGGAFPILPRPYTTFPDSDIDPRVTSRSTPTAAAERLDPLWLSAGDEAQQQLQQQLDEAVGNFVRAGERLLGRHAGGVGTEAPLCAVLGGGVRPPLMPPLLAAGAPESLAAPRAEEAASLAATAKARTAASRAAAAAAAQAALREPAATQVAAATASPQAVAAQVAAREQPGRSTAQRRAATPAAAAVPRATELPSPRPVPTERDRGLPPPPQPPQPKGLGGMGLPHRTTGRLSGRFPEQQGSSGQLLGTRLSGRGSNTLSAAAAANVAAASPLGMPPSGAGGFHGARMLPAIASAVSLPTLPSSASGSASIGGAGPAIGSGHSCPTHAARPLNLPPNDPAPNAIAPGVDAATIFSGPHNNDLTPQLTAMGSSTADAARLPRPANTATAPGPLQPAAVTSAITRPPGAFPPLPGPHYTDDNGPQHHHQNAALRALAIRMMRPPSGRALKSAKPMVLDTNNGKWYLAQVVEEAEGGQVLLQFCGYKETTQRPVTDDTIWWGPCAKGRGGGAGTVGIKWACKSPKEGSWVPKPWEEHYKRLGLEQVMQAIQYTAQTQPTRPAKRGGAGAGRGRGAAGKRPRVAAAAAGEGECGAAAAAAGMAGAVAAVAAAGAGGPLAGGEEEGKVAGGRAARVAAVERQAPAGNPAAAGGDMAGDVDMGPAPDVGDWEGSTSPLTGRTGASMQVEGSRLAADSATVEGGGSSAALADEVADDVAVVAAGTPTVPRRGATSPGAVAAGGISSPAARAGPSSLRGGAAAAGVRSPGSEAVASALAVTLMFHRLWALPGAVESLFLQQQHTQTQQLVSPRLPRSPPLPRQRPRKLPRGKVTKKGKSGGGVTSPGRAAKPRRAGRGGGSPAAGGGGGGATAVAAAAGVEGWASEGGAAAAATAAAAVPSPPPPPPPAAAVAAAAVPAVPSPPPPPPPPPAAAAATAVAATPRSHNGLVSGDQAAGAGVGQGGVHFG